jgi:phage shock protein C
MPDNITTLYRSRENVLFGGVCAGLGDYLNINPAYVRLFFVLLVFGNGIGILLYLLFWIMIPLNGQVQPASLAQKIQTGSQEIAAQTRAAGEDLWGMIREQQTLLGVLVGTALIVIGLLYLLQILHLDWLGWLKFDLIWPLLLILGGLALLIRRPKGE